MRKLVEKKAKPIKPLSSFKLYGVLSLDIEADGDKTVQLKIKATPDVETDLLHAGLGFHGFGGEDVQAFRKLLKNAVWRQSFQNLLDAVKTVA